MAFRDIMSIFFRDDDPFHASLTGAISLFKDAADGLDLALDGNFPGQGHILADRLACDGRDEGRRNGTTCRRAVDIAAADEVDVDIVIGQFLTGHAADDSGCVEHGVLGHGAGRIVEAVIALPRRPRRKGDGFDFNGRAEVAGDAEAEDLADDRRIAGLFRHIRHEAADLGDAADVVAGDARGPWSPI